MSVIESVPRAARATLAAVAAGAALLGYTLADPGVTWASLAAAALLAGAAAGAARTRLVDRSVAAEAVRAGGAVAAVPVAALAGRVAVAAVRERLAPVMGAAGDAGGKAALLAVGSTQSGLLVAVLLAAATLPPAMAGAALARAALGTDEDAVAPARPAPDDLPLARGTRVGLVAGAGAVLALLATLVAEASVGGGPVALALRPVLEAVTGGPSPPSSVGATTTGVALGLVPPATVGLLAGVWYRTNVAVPALGDRLRILALVNAVPVAAGVATLVAVTVTVAVQHGLVAAVIYGPIILFVGTLALLAVVPVVVGVPATVGYAVGELLGAGVGPPRPGAT